MGLTMQIFSVPALHRSEEAGFQSIFMKEIKNFLDI